MSFKYIFSLCVVNCFVVSLCNCAAERPDLKGWRGEVRILALARCQRAGARVVPALRQIAGGLELLQRIGEVARELSVKTISVKCFNRINEFAGHFKHTYIINHIKDGKVAEWGEPFEGEVTFPRGNIRIDIYNKALEDVEMTWDLTADQVDSLKNCVAKGVWIKFFDINNNLIRLPLRGGLE